MQSTASPTSPAYVSTHRFNALCARRYPPSQIDAMLQACETCGQPPCHGIKCWAGTTPTTFRR